MTTRYLDITTPVGSMRLISEGEEALSEILFANQARRQRPPSDWLQGGRLLRRAARQLEEYFAGRRKIFDLPLAPQGTPFQRRVWQELQRIDHGETISYGELARRIGRPAASRAVGAANGKNPISVVIPCHRVVGSDGSLTGFGGGLPTKRKLIDLETSAQRRLL